MADKNECNRRGRTGLIYVLCFGDAVCARLCSGADAADDADDAMLLLLLLLPLLPPLLVLVQTVVGRCIYMR